MNFLSVSIHLPLSPPFTTLPPPLPSLSGPNFETHRVNAEHLNSEVLEQEILTALTLGDMSGPIEIQISYDLVLAGRASEDQETYSIFRGHQAIREREEQIFRLPDTSLAEVGRMAEQLYRLDHLLEAEKNLRDSHIDLEVGFPPEFRVTVYVRK